MQDLGLLNMQEVHALGHVKRHPVPLPQCQLNGALLMEQREESAAEAELSQDEHVAALVVRAGSHEVDQVGVAHLDER